MPKKVATLTEEEIIAARKKLAANRKKQDILREEELAIRTYLADIFHDGEEGSKTVTVGGIKFTIKRSLNRSITRDEAERLGREYPNESLDILSWRPEVRVSGYKEHTAIADNYITTKPGPPTVEFKD